MIPLREIILTNSSTRIITENPFLITLLYLIGGYFIGILISALFGILKIFQYLLPKPPRDLTDSTVVITGVTCSIGRCLAKEFARVGCKIVCIDKDHKKLRQIIHQLDKVYGLSTTHRRQPVIIEEDNKEPRTAASHNNNNNTAYYLYECNLWNRDSIRHIAKKIENDIGPADILITCAGNNNNNGQDIYDTVSKTLMSHYWTVVAFLPSMLKQEKIAHVVEVTPTTSTKDAYMGTRAAIIGLMENLAQQFHHSAGHINFFTIAPKADPKFIEQSEEKVAFTVVQAIKRNQCCFSRNYTISRLLYCINWTISKVTR